MHYIKGYQNPTQMPYDEYKMQKSSIYLIVFLKISIFGRSSHDTISTRNAHEFFEWYTL